MNYKQLMKSDLPIKSGYSITGTYTQGGDLKGFHYKTTRRMQELNIADLFNFLEKQNIDKNLLLSIDFNRVKYKEDDKSKEKWYERVDGFCKFYIGNIKPFNEVEDFQYFCPMDKILEAKKDNSSVISCAGTYGTETIYPYSALSKYHPNFILPLNDLEKLEVLSPSKTDNITLLSKPTFMHFANNGADKLLEENPNIVEDIAGLE